MTIKDFLSCCDSIDELTDFYLYDNPDYYSSVKCEYNFAKFKYDGLIEKYGDMVITRLYIWSSIDRIDFLIENCLTT